MVARGINVRRFVVCSSNEYIEYNSTVALGYSNVSCGLKIQAKFSEMWQLTSPNCYHNTNAKIPRIELQDASTYFVHRSDLSTYEILDASGGKLDTMFSVTKLPTFGKNLRPPASILDSSWRQCVLR